MMAHTFQTNGYGLLCLFILTTFWTPLANGVEQTVQNDSLIGGSSGSIQAGFVAGERAAVWLTSPCDGNIVAVQVLWRSLTGTAPQTFGQDITISTAGAFPVPGTTLAALFGPVMTDSVFNEFRFLDQNNTIPINVPVTTGQVFVVSFGFQSTPNQTQGPSLVSDIDGCQAGKNAINASGLGWFNACALGVSGDFAIRAVINCGAPTGACCLADGTCQDAQTDANCITAGGAFQGAGSTCATITCPIPMGACCFQPSGCVNLTQADCTTASGFWQGAGTDCATTLCFPTGACCMPDGTCADSVLDTDCLAAGGTFQGDGVLCSGVSCPQPTGACCLMNGSCLVLTQGDCNVIPASTSWAGPGTNCADLNGNGTADACEPACAGADGDVNLDTLVNGLDIQSFVDAMIAGGTADEICHGDFDGSAMIDIGDVSGMVSSLLVP